MFKRWIAVGAVLGMMGTMGVLTMLPSEVRYEDVVKLSKERLADTMRRIEFYKAEHGSYPETLKVFADKEDVKHYGNGERVFFAIVNYPPSMMDPTLKFQKEFYYESTPDGRYYLRSRGLDGSAFTGDDIVPDVKRRPEGSVGLVEARIASSDVVQALPQ
ncbi:hypothetical protein [Aureimonas sp. SK2]|uniref:hypothetical protein n=1 Tax=Aureimonas sp. SK2 TaxID=3015992 RepID=UPI0024452145|nr:hypothetical protein [Aureimonas sp. SK2]